MDVAFFTTQSKDSLALAEAVYSLLEDQNVNFYLADRQEDELTPEHFLGACIEMDLVIFDGTREADHNNYDLANELMKNLPHVIIVSRNYLPVNLYSVVKGGYPDYLTEKMTNAKIIAWLQVCLPDLLKERPAEDKILENQMGILQKSLDIQRHQLAAATNVFISYRTKYEKKNANFPTDYQYSVSELAERIKAGSYHQGKSRSVKYLSNGALAFEDELLTEHRMWQLLSIIDDEVIINCDEFWIYGSADYVNSWWTQGELMILANALQSAISTTPFNPDKLLKFYNPVTDQVTSIPLSDYPQLNETQIKKKSRLYTTTSPSQMGPESNTIKNRTKRFSFLFRNPLTKWIFKPWFRKAFEAQMEVYRQQNMPYVETFDFDTMYDTYFSKEYLNDRAFSKGFWNDLRFLPPLEETDTAEKFLKRDFKLDFDHFFDYIEKRGLTIDATMLRDDRIELGERRYRVQQENSRYYFSPSRFGLDVSSTQQNLEVVPTYRLVEIRD